MTKYDPVDNILGISNVITPKAPKKPKGFGGPGRTDGMGGLDAGKEKKEKPLGGAFSHTYAYDELNRLIRAEGKAKGIGYAMDMSFGLMGEPLTKVQRTDSGSVAGSYALAYEYGDADHPTAPSQIGHERYTYDANGNPTLVEDDSLNTEHRMYWDEENRLMALSDNDKTSRYTYNAAGERVVKSHGYLEGMYVNGAPQGLTSDCVDFRLRFGKTSKLLFLSACTEVPRDGGLHHLPRTHTQRFTKHYFIGDRRVASKIGAGIFQNAYGHGANVVTAGQKDYQMRMMQIEKQREDYYRKLGTPPGVPTMKGATAEPENTHEGYNTIIKELGDHSVPDGWIQRPKRNAVPDTPPGPPVQWDKAEDPDDVQPGYGYVPADTAHHEDIFYYHTDHLGSTSYITDAKANVAQFDAYLPYGELLVDEHSSSEEMPYKFNGKELDSETGLYYYGARYMNPRTSLWYGVDPLTEENPSIGVYTYCADNPIRNIDSDGERIIGIKEKNAVYLDKQDKITFTKFATQDIRRIVAALMMTKEGEKILYYAIRSKILVKMNISIDAKIEKVAAGNNYIYGETLQGNFNKNDSYGRRENQNGTYSITEASITIYEGTLKEDAKTENPKHKGLTLEQAIGAVAGHELVHGTYGNEINKDIKYELKGKKSARPDREILPNKVEHEIIKQSRDLNKE